MPGYRLQQLPSHHRAEEFLVAVIINQDNEEKVGVIHISSFNARTLRDLKTAIMNLEVEGATRIMLDLRDNRGGLVSEGLEVSHSKGSVSCEGS